MKIQSLRFGFATNSSSSHSVVVLQDSRNPAYTDFNHGYINGYEWNWFVLADPESKMEYLATQMLQSMSHDELSYGLSGVEYDDTKREACIRALMDLLNIDEAQAEYYMDLQRSVDHQSYWGVNWTSLDPQLIEDIKQFLQDPRVAILGGNDNSNDLDRQEEYGNDVEFFRHISNIGSSNVKVLNYGNSVWSMFDAASGNKLRFSLNLDVSEHVSKSPVPELVDLKITDYCNFGCEWCYQSSTKNGIHAPKERIFQIVDKLVELGTFEIALGGGEPTQHPDFLEIIQYIRDRGIVPNFTTFSLNWIKNAEFSSAVKLFAGGVGLSVQTEKDLLKYSRKEHGRDYKVMLQHVLGASPVSETLKIIDFASENFLPLLLLGYKDVGFGKSYTKYDYQDLPLLLKLRLKDKYRWLSLSMDSALLNEIPEITSVLESPRELSVDASEGKFSMYIDAVEPRMARSSYVEKNQMMDLDLTGLLDFWRTL
jgi:hypothetical protein